jgi:cation:H+ antiporter
MLLRMLTGHEVIWPLAAFTLTGVAVFPIGSRLARHADAISDATGLGRAWIGTVPIAVVLTAIAGAALASGGWGHIGSVGLETLLILGIYSLGMRAVYGSMRPTAPQDQLELGETSRTLLRRGLVGFALATAGLLVTAPLVVLSAEAVSLEGGLTQTFVGTLLVGFTTSLPEMAATFAAVRLGAFDLAVGNMLGSNAFNMCILLAMDVAYRPGSVLALLVLRHRG